MFGGHRHAANSEFVRLDEASRWVLDGLTLKMRSQSAPTLWPKNFPQKDRTRANASGQFREAHREVRGFTPRSVKGCSARMRE